VWAIIISKITHASQPSIPVAFLFYSWVLTHLGHHTNRLVSWISSSLHHTLPGTAAWYTAGTWS
jgi:hypothetical protein